MIDPLTRTQDNQVTECGFLGRDEIGQLKSERTKNFCRAGQRGEENDLQTCLFLTHSGTVLSMENWAESRTGIDLKEPDLRQAVMYIFA